MFLLNCDLDLWPMTLTFALDLHINYVHLHAQFGDSVSSGFWDMNYFLVNFGPVNFGGVTDGQTDRQKVMHMSPPCISTGVLKCSKIYIHFNSLFYPTIATYLSTFLTQHLCLFLRTNQILFGTVQLILEKGQKRHQTFQNKIKDKYGKCE